MEKRIVALLTAIVIVLSFVGCSSKCSNHTEGEWIMDKEATCTEDGLKHQVCSSCGGTIKTEVIPMTGHTVGEWTEEEGRICSVCGEALPDIMPEICYGEVLLPSDIHVASGRQLNLWWSTATNTEEGDRSVYFETQCDIGKNTQRGYVLNATDSQIGEHTLIIRCRDLRTRKILGEGETVIHVVGKRAGSGDRNILMIGDSRTWHSVGGEQGKTCIQGDDKTTTTELKRLLDGNKGSVFTFWGTYQSSKDPTVKNLADNGWTYARAVEYLENAGGVRKYLEETCKGQPGMSLDYVTAMFGINDLADWGENNLDQYGKSVGKIESIIASAKELVDLILKDYPNCRIVLVLESSTAANQDGFAYWGGTNCDSQTEWEYAVKALRKRMIEEFDGGKYSSKVTLSSAGLWCDRLYGFPYVLEKASDRSEGEDVLHLINSVHPHDSGYKQISDGYFSTLKYLESLSK